MSFKKPKKAQVAAIAPPPPPPPVAEEVKTDVNADGANQAADRTENEAKRINRRKLRIGLDSNPTAGGGSGLAIY